MPRVLALDTATDACTLAWCGEGDLRARHERLARAHNRHILGMLTDILAGRSLASAVDVIACGVGPGSFTGLRVAVSVAQGLAWARDTSNSWLLFFIGAGLQRGSARLAVRGAMGTLDH